MHTHRHGSRDHPVFHDLKIKTPGAMVGDLEPGCLYVYPYISTQCAYAAVVDHASKLPHSYELRPLNGWGSLFSELVRQDRF